MHGSTPPVRPEPRWRPLRQTGWHAHAAFQKRMQPGSIKHHPRTRRATVPPCWDSLGAIAMIRSGQSLHFRLGFLMSVLPLDEVALEVVKDMQRARCRSRPAPAAAPPHWPQRPHRRLRRHGHLGKCLVDRRSLVMARIMSVTTPPAKTTQGAMTRRSESVTLPPGDPRRH